MILGFKSCGFSHKVKLLILISLQPNGEHVIRKLVDLIEFQVWDIWIKLVINLTKLLILISLQPDVVYLILK